MLGANYLMFFVFCRWYRPHTSVPVVLQYRTRRCRVQLPVWWRLPGRFQFPIWLKSWSDRRFLISNLNFSMPSYPIHLQTYIPKWGSSSTSPLFSPVFFFQTYRVSFTSYLLKVHVYMFRINKKSMVAIKLIVSIP